MKIKKSFLVFIFGVVLILIGLIGGVSAAKFNIGDTVEVYNTGASGLVVRGPNACDAQIGGKWDGDKGTVLSGPVFCSSYNRWKIRWGGGLEGWSAEDWLRKVSIVTVPSVETRAASSIGQTSAFLNARVLNDGGASILERRFSWGTTFSCSDGWTNTDIEVSGDYFSYYLTGLQPGTTYYFQSWARNSAGWGNGNVVSFTTSQPSCSCTSWINGACGGGSCSSTQRQQTRTCTPSGCDSESKCVSDASCQTCTPNLKRCNGNIVETCKSDGSSWTTTQNCGKTSYCSANSCISCTSNTANCNENPSDACEINLMTDNNNCGSCGNVCGAGQSCQSGVCECSQNLYGLPATSGKVSYFCDTCCSTSAWGVPLGPDCGSDDATKYWFVAMRWPYYDPCTGFSDPSIKSWWHNKKILVTNPSNGKQVVLAVKDWGPCNSCILNCPISAQNRVIDVSKAALDSLGAVTDNVLNIEFADPNALLGPVGSSSVSKPPVVSRTEWGCPDGQSSPNWWDGPTPKYSSVTHIIIHHTVTPNQLPWGSGVDTWDKVVHKIWDMHALKLGEIGTWGVGQNGWGDIGYNYLIDPNGIIYEGRAGGDNVIGAHAGKYNSGSMGISFLGTFSTTEPTPVALRSAESLIAWKLNQQGLDPLEQATLVDKFIYRISGHRDVSAGNECPGQKLYNLLPAIRQNVFNILNGGGPDNLPNVNAFSVSPSSVSLGNSFAISYTVSDDIGLSKVALWRADDSNGEPINWNETKSNSISGKTYSGNFTDAPGLVGNYWYGIHVNDNSGNSEHWNDERNSRTGGLPDVYGPIKVSVVSCTSGQTKCGGNTYYECENNAWVNKGITIGKCGVECLSGDKCVRTDYYVCSNYKWINQGKVIDKCGVECTTKSHCGTDGYVGSKYCVGSSVKQEYRVYSCLNYVCSYTETEENVENCGSDYCNNFGNNYCKGGDVYHSRTCYNKGCSGGGCFSSPYDDEQLVQTCEHGCEDGECVERLEGDVNGDCEVDIFDLAAVGLCYGKSPTGSCLDADLNSDGSINIFDLATVGLNYGKIC